LSNGFDNRVDNRLYRVNGASETAGPDFTKFSLRVTRGRMDRSSSDDVTLCTSGFADGVMFPHSRAYVVYGEAYGRGMSVSGRQRRQGRSFSADRGGASALQLRPCLPCLPLATPLDRKPCRRRRRWAVEANSASRTAGATSDIIECIVERMLTRDQWR